MQWFCITANDNTTKVRNVTCCDTVTVMNKCLASFVVHFGFNFTDCVSTQHNYLSMLLVFLALKRSFPLVTDSV